MELNNDLSCDCFVFMAQARLYDFLSLWLFWPSPHPDCKGLDSWERTELEVYPPYRIGLHHSLKSETELLRLWRNSNVRDLRFFLMQEHIQQVSLSELMTSWSHILPAPLPQSGATEGQWEVCVRVCVWEWVCSGSGGGGSVVYFIPEMD